MAGHAIALYLTKQGYDVVGFAKTKSSICDTIIGDALNPQDIEAALSVGAERVINCIGVLNNRVDLDLDMGIYLNAVLPHFLARKLRDSESKLVHISTDCVFNGFRGGYMERDTPNEDSYYGRSKAMGEVIDNKNLTFRTSIIGPEISDHGIGLFGWFMGQSDVVTGYSRVIWTGVTTLALSKAIEEEYKNPVTGIYHLVNNKTVSKYELLCLFNKYFRSNKLKINVDDRIISDKSLINTRGELINIPDYEDMIGELKIWIAENEIYHSRYEIL